MTKADALYWFNLGFGAAENFYASVLEAEQRNPDGHGELFATREERKALFDSL